MDAANLPLKKNLLFLALALFVAAPGLKAVTPPSFSLTTTAVTLQSNQGQQVGVSSSDATQQITFSPAIVYGDNANLNWLSVTGIFTTPTTVFVALGGAAGSLPSGTHTATVTLNASSPAGVTPVSFTVTYTTGSSGGGGGGTITASPSSVALSANPGNVTSQQITLSTASATGITFTVVSDQPSWLTGSPNSFTVSNGNPDPMFVIATAGNLANGTYTGHLTITPSSGATTVITVTFTVGSGGGSGGTLTFTTPNAWNYTTGGTFPNNQTILFTNSTAATYSASVTTSNGVQWLLADNATSVNGAAVTSGIILSASANLPSVSTGTFTGTVAVTDSNGATGSITLPLTVNGASSGGLTVSPSAGATLTASAGGTSAQVPITITSTINGSLSITPINAPWLSVLNSPSSITAGFQTTVNLSASAALLQNGTQTGSLQVQVNGSSTLTQTIPITFVVGTGSGTGGGGNLSVAPASLFFTYQTGTNPSFVSRQTVALTGPAGAGWTSTIATSDGGGWLALSTVSANLQQDGTGTTTVIINPTGLAANTYSGTVNINITGGGSQSVSVTLQVVGGPILLSTPGSVVFNYHTGDATPQPQALFLAASDGSAVSATASTATPWLTVSPTTGASSIGVTVNPAGMAAGLYSGSVTVTQNGLSNNPLTIPVVLIINGGSTTGGGTGSLTLPASITFNALAGVNPPSQAVSIGAASTTSFTAAATTFSGGNWLSLGQTSGIAPGASLSVFVNSASLVVGTYTGSITFTANGVNQSVPVTLNVTTSANGGNVTATPASLSFTGQVGAGSLFAQALTISSTQGTSAVNFTLSTSGGSWLTTSAPSGGTFLTPLQLTVNVNVNTGSLPAGTYNGSITITPTGGNVVTVPVTLTVTGLPTVSATPTSLTFAYRAGDPTPASQPVSVAGGGASLPFTATASSNGNWLVVSPASGTTPATLNVSVNATGLNASPTPYTGIITVSGTGTATGNTTISVSLTVTAPLPTVSKLTNAGSFVSGSISPGEIITLFGTGIGPVTPAGLTLDGTGKVSTTIGGVQVLVQGFACPMVYASNTQVSAVVPYEIAGFVSTDVLVKYVGLTSNAIHVNVATTAPGLFTLNSSGTGPGAILNSNNSFNSPNNPAARGDIVVIYMTGEGQTSPAGVTGKVTTVSSTPPLTPGPLLGVSVLIGPPGAQQPANFTFAGEAPGLVSGAMQLNVQIPTSVGSGDQQIVVSVGGNQSQSGVTVSVK